MKINKFEVACELHISEEGILSGSFKLPAPPHTQYTLEINVEELARAQFDASEEVEEIEPGLPVDPLATGGEVVQLPDDSVAPVLPVDLSDADAAKIGEGLLNETDPAAPTPPETVAPGDETGQQ